MSSCKYTDFGLCVKTELLRRGMNQDELIEKVRADTGGLFVDGSYLYKIFTGQRSAPKIVDSINRILGLQSADEERRDG